MNRNGRQKKMATNRSSQRDILRHELVRQQHDTKERPDQQQAPGRALQEGHRALGGRHRDGGADVLVLLTLAALQARLDDVAGRDDDRRHGPRDHARQECAGKTDTLVHIGDVVAVGLAEDAVIGPRGDPLLEVREHWEVKDRERHIAQEGRAGALVHAAHAAGKDSADDLREGEALGGVGDLGLLLHADLEHLHRARDDDLSKASHTASDRLVMQSNGAVCVAQALATIVVHGELERLLRNDPDQLDREPLVEREEATLAVDVLEALPDAMVPLRLLLQLHQRLAEVDRKGQQTTNEPGKAAIDEVLLEVDVGRINDWSDSHSRLSWNS
eukprot:m.227901 g.227901  ORF g.227901 m.227901 type:complete len:330 (-) comp11666_c0_seq1:2-991(-)